MKLQILVAAMHQTDGSLAKKMNIRCDAIIANQHDRTVWTEEMTDGGKLTMITTETRGVGINRNLALMAADADILLFADDDLVYYDRTAELVLRAFAELPRADVICFGLDMTKNGEIYEKRRYRVKRLHIYNAMRFGGARIAIRRSAVVKHRLSFSHLFGGGCIYGSGEDSLFLCDCFRAGLRVYSHSVVLGTCAKDGSTWFAGYNEKYLYDKGAWLACAFPHTKHLVKWHFIRKFTKRAGISFAETARLIGQGIRGYKTLAPYRPSADAES